MNPHPQPRIMSPISIFVHSICVDHVLFLNKTAAMRSCRRAWGRVSHAAHCPFWPGKLNLILYRLALICLKATSIPSFPPPISHQLFPCSEAVMTFNMFNDAVLASSVYVITGFARCIKGWVTVIWGSSPLTHSDRGFRTWIKGDYQLQSLGGKHQWHSSPWFSLMLDAVI